MVIFEITTITMTGVVNFHMSNQTKQELIVFSTAISVVILNKNRKICLATTN